MVEQFDATGTQTNKIEIRVNGTYKLCRNVLK